MDAAALSALLDQLIANWEDEVVEFKDVGDSFSSSKLGKYFSALSNEANLRDRDRGWLVFGVDNTSRSVVGSRYKIRKEHLHADKKVILDGTRSITVREIHVLEHEAKRVVLFEIPAAPLGIAISWNGHCYGRAGESLVALGQDKLDDIRAQTWGTDWTACVVENGNMSDLDTQALAAARERFVTKHANRFSADAIAEWSDEVVLERARVTQTAESLERLSYYWESPRQPGS